MGEEGRRKGGRSRAHNANNIKTADGRTAIESSPSIIDLAVAAAAGDVDSNGGSPFALSPLPFLPPLLDDAV